MNIDTPAFIASKEGIILCRNFHLKYIYQHLDIDELKSLDEIKFKKCNTEEGGMKKFVVEGTPLTGYEYQIKFCNNTECMLYVFQRTFTSERIISNLIEHIDEVVVIFDQDGVIQRMNSICDQLLPFNRKEVIGKNITQLVKEGKVENPIITEMINTKQKVYRDITYPDGKVISYTAIPITSSNGRLKGGVLTGRDVSRVINLAKTSSDKNDLAIEYISSSEEIEKIKAIISRVAPSDASVFIIGESGVGKEIIARSIWNQSTRRNKNFVAINCASIPAELIESELFGYEKGAFTGANKEGKIGLIESADGGTLFLDEIGELPIETQKKFLRVIQENAIMRIGGVKPKKINVRYISATNKTTEELKDPKIFRQDLYYRLNVIPLIIPPLRKRKDDILPISNYYIDVFNSRYNRKVELSEEAEEILLKNDWKGNIRELKNVIERLVILSAQEKIFSEQIERILALGHIKNLSDEGDVSDKNIEIADDKIVINDFMNIDDAHRIVEQEILKKALSKYGSITKAATAVGINPSTVYRKIKSGYINLD